jgi:hypothetical protein
MKRRFSPRSPRCLTTPFRELQPGELLQYNLIRVAEMNELDKALDFTF